MTSEPVTVLAIDPGTLKCGVAVLRGAEQQVLHRSVVPTDELADIVARLSREHSPSVILVGNGTSAGAAVESIERISSIVVELVDEKMTSIAARTRYFRENPPRGLRRLIPTSLQTPSQPYDDYVAVILAERYLASAERPAS